MTERKTIFSPCRQYRYTLWRKWDDEHGEGTRGEITREECHYVQFIGLNPSTADEVQDDNTIRRCIQYAKDWGYGAFCMTNLFAWCDTLPENMKAAVEPVGAENDHWITEIAKGAGVVVAAWGNDGKHLYRGTKVKRILADAGIQLHCLRKTKAGQPEHPLYLKKTLKPIPLT